MSPPATWRWPPTGTRFGVNGVNIGLFCSTPMVALTRAVPPKVAFEMLTTGQFIDAARAREIGLVNRVTAPEALAAETRALAETVAAKLSAAVKIGKRAFYDQLTLDPPPPMPTPAPSWWKTCSGATPTRASRRFWKSAVAATGKRAPPDWAGLSTLARPQPGVLADTPHRRRVRRTSPPRVLPQRTRWSPRGPPQLTAGRSPPNFVSR